MFKRVTYMAYALLAYGAFLATYLYTIGFVSGIYVANPLDGAAIDPWWLALAIDAGLIGVFALQHSGMARPAFKRWWTRMVPEPIERATYVLLSCVALALLFWQWRPLGGTVWSVEDPGLKGLLDTVACAGWLGVPAASFFINHFDLFGLRQAWLHLRGKPYTPLRFGVPGPYKYVRHPLYVAWLMAFWATPTMSVAHLVFALGMSAYILMAIRVEERDLEAFHGAAYRAYRKRVPMLIPNLGAGKEEAEALLKGETTAL
ncbi:MAG: isoprenylcysteine carboxylmethyltransferase family protein [Planctomycetota bacterium]|nr:isoprenylcysteine carboxylmethyltransferase family protein [Planctomycetota bacterium]